MHPKDSACATIYALLDPDTNDVCYVGRTTQTLAGRLRHHCQAARYGQRYKDHVNFATAQVWFAGVLAQGKKPRIAELERVPLDEAAEAEARWINHYAHLPTLTNVNGVHAYEAKPPEALRRIVQGVFTTD